MSLMLHLDMSTIIREALSVDHSGSPPKSGALQSCRSTFHALFNAQKCTYRANLRASAHDLQLFGCSPETPIPVSP